VVSDPAGVTGVAAEFWGKIFERAPTVEQKLRLNQFLDRFAPQLPAVELPQPSLHSLARAAERAPPSAPGAGQLPRAAWRRSPGAPLHPRALMEQLFNEGAGPHDLNWSLCPCASKGAEGEDTPDSCTCAASTVRALSLNNAGAKLIAACADRALQPIATVAAEGAQKGFTAGRRCAGHIPLLDAECRRVGLLPGTGAPLGYCNAISALRCNRIAFSSFRVPGGSAAMEPLFALRCGIMQRCLLSGTVWRLGMDAPIRALIKVLGDPPKGCLAARAGDLGTLIRNAKILPSIADSFVDIEFAFNLQLAIHKCALVPLWEEVTPDLINDARTLLAEMAPSWKGFRVAPSAKYLGSRIGPGIAEQGIWKDAAAKWWSRAAELSRAGMAASLAARAYNVSALPRLSYLAQFFFSSPRSGGALKGSWSPPWWATKSSIVQNYGLVMDLCGTLPRPRPAFDKVPAPVPTTIIEAARIAMGDEEKEAAQAAAMRTIRDGLYEERFDQLIGRRPRRRGIEAPAEELRSRWLELRAALRAARPAWMRSRLRTISNGWITSGRMHVIAPRLRIMGSEARDDLSHYIARPVLRGAVAAPAEESELSSGALFSA
ncbi:unnamed protein product, partial [Prorocentrum cordatum]